MSGAIFKTAVMSVAMNRIHAAPYPITVRRIQPHDISRGGVFYLYDRATKAIDHRLLFTRLDAATVGALWNFADAVKTTGEPFIWADPLYGEREVRITSRITVREPLPDRLSVALTVTEYLSQAQLALIDSMGDTLLMSDGSEMLGAAP